MIDDNEYRECKEYARYKNQISEIESQKLLKKNGER